MLSHLVSESCLSLHAAIINEIIVGLCMQISTTYKDIDTGTQNSPWPVASLLAARTSFNLSSHAGSATSEGSDQLGEPI